MERRTGTPIEKWDDVNGKTKDATAVSVNDLSQGERFIQLRESTGMNRAEFADYLGIPYRTMQDWERDARTMPNYVFALIEYKVTAEFGLRVPQELDPNTIGNVRRGLEDQLEQNDNMIGDGVINNVAPQNPVENMKDDNANGIPDEQEKSIKELEAERDNLTKELYEYESSVDMYMLSRGGESDYSDGMVDDIIAMRQEIEALDAKIEGLHEQQEMESVSVNAEKKSLLDQLHELKPEPSERPHRSLYPELVL
ncbi:helix-turn-helix domain-containing protein [Butyrivibrio sp.]|uniref:helix-turn-helix domain-containing protein n=1 Tax=Butyrivibrio sp. TaxID=28121 RepID=UPI002ED66D92